jgi:predicted ArsR family transcriptional regulator
MTERRAATGRDTQLTRLAALGEPIRQALYRFVVAQRTPVSRDQAASGLGIARHVAKFHLDRLAADGLVDTEYQRPDGRGGPGAGRPTKFYRASRTEIAVSLPERHYDLAADILAQAVTIAERDATPLREALRLTARQAGARLGRPSGNARPPERADAPWDGVWAVLAAHGYEPELDSADPSAARITLRNCPFHRLARAHTDLVCGLNLDVLTAVVDNQPGCGLLAELDPGPDRCCVVLTAVAGADQP